MTVYACNGENLTETDDPMKRAMRQIAGVFAEIHNLAMRPRALLNQAECVSQKMRPASLLRAHGYSLALFGACARAAPIST